MPCRSKSSAVSRTRGQARSTFCLAPEQGHKKEEILGKVQKTRTNEGTHTRPGLMAEWGGEYEMYLTFSDPQGYVDEAIAAARVGSGQESEGRGRF